MALYQPTFIYPDLRNGLGQGTVDAAADLAVSWRVNGNSAMTAFSIAIYRNDAASTQLFTTGKISDGCPFFGTTNTGEIRFFSYTISAAALASAGVVNGAEYKLVIRQWWSADDSVTQSSASVFVTRSAPVLSIPEIGSIDTRFYTFTAQYSQAQGDVLNWFRWQLAYADHTDAPFFDSGQIGGTMDVRAYYDGFFTGTEYAVRCSIQTECGIETDTGWIGFSVEYDTMTVTGGIIAKPACGSEAVDVDWSGVAYIPGTAEGEYSIEDGILDLPAGSSVAWDAVNYQPMALAAPWGMIYRAKLQNADAALLSLGQSGGDLSLSYDYAAHTLTLKQGGAVLAVQGDIRNHPTVTVLLTPTTLYIRSEYVGGGLYPSETLYPGAALFPLADTISMADVYQIAVDYQQTEITSVRVGGVAAVDFLEITKGAPGAETIREAVTDGGYVPEVGGGDWFLADFTDGLNASNLNVGDEVIVGYALYRRKGSGGVLLHVADVDEKTTEIFDYGAAGGDGAYTYYLFPVGETSYLAQPIVSNAVSPCFPDWSILECAETENRNIFSVLAEFRFGKNFSSGPMSNNNRPNVLENFTPYPTVQLSPQNYRSGTLTSLIGHVDRSDGQARYYDTLALRDRIFALSMTENTLFLKNRKGDLLKVRCSDSISMQTMDESREQAQTVTLSWVEVGSAEGVSLIADGSMTQRG